MPKKGGGGREGRTVFKFKGSLGKKEEVVFLRGRLIPPMHTMIYIYTYIFQVKLFIVRRPGREMTRQTKKRHFT